jgi:hypothetical protein
MTRRASARKNALAALLFAIVSAAAFCFCLMGPASAFGEASYVFEPKLSLTGNCTTSLKDEVSDPGLCPIPPGTVFSGSPGADHPSTRLEAPSVTVDSYGDIYVVSMLEAKSRIDVFASDGTFITEFADTAGPQSIAVDGKGNVYLFERLAGGAKQIRRFPPKVYEPEKKEIEYGEEPVVLANDKTKPVIPLSFESSLAVDPVSQRLYFDTSHAIAVFDSAGEENKLLEPEAIKGLVESSSFAIDAKHKKVYVADKNSLTSKSLVRIFELEAPHGELGKNTGSTTPKGEFLSGEGFLEIDVDEETGHLFVGDIAAASKVYEFDESGAYLATIEHSFETAVGPGGIPGEIAVDNGPKSPRPQKETWLFVPSVPSGSTGHVYAFEPREECKPEVEATSVGDITETDATLHGTINPCGLETTYRFEYVSQEQFEASGFAEATLAGEGTLPKGAEDVPVSAPALGLQPGTKYRFSLVAENTAGEAEEEKSFKTFPAAEGTPICENEAVRTGLSVLLPDCRAYELVTPPDTNGRSPTGGYSGSFPTLLASPAGDRATFVVEGGLIPGSEGTGSFDGDRYLATRGAEGWSTSVDGPNGEEAFKITPGSVSPDQTYAIWSDDSGAHIRYPDGHSELIGRGSLGEDPKVTGRLLTEGGSHIVFETKAGIAVQLEPDAPPAGTATVYDRSAEGVTQVVSLLPEDKVPNSGENAAYLGDSEDGNGIAFEIEHTIYLRLNDAETFKVAGSAAEFAGVAAGGKRVFYLEGGDLFAFDTEAPEPIAFSESGDVTVVNVAPGGTRAYFVSPSVLTTSPNPNGEEAEAGKENLYLSEEGEISFVGTVTERDVKGEKFLGGLGLWIEAFRKGGPARDPSRTTPSGTTLLFESRANLAGFDPEGFAEIYRYDSAQKRLDCLSCNPTGLPPTSDASLQSIGAALGAPEPGNANIKIPNQSPDGRRAFFQTAEQLVLGDLDGQLDIYEWEEKGLGSCKKEGGCVSLISGGHSSSPDYLFAMSSSGDDVFFRTADILLPRDLESTLSIYDARIEGGFVEAGPCRESCCGGGACQQPAGSAPELPQPSTSATGPSGNFPPGGGKCPKGKRKAKRNGKTVCVKNNHKHKGHHRKAGSHRKGGSK